MKRNSWLFLLFFLGGTVFLTPAFYYHDQKSVVEPTHYRNWEMTYERVVIARLAKSEQDGFLSAGGLLGLAGVKAWNFEIDPQYEIYKNGKYFKQYFPYQSNPGIQGIVFSLIDQVTDFTPEQNIIIFRMIVALLSALVVAFLSACMAMEFHWFSGVLILVFSVLSEWMILPAGNMYWNLWAFYFPFAMAMLVFHKASKNNHYSEIKILFVLFIAALVKVLVTGFEMITTALIMTTVPFVFYAIYDRWQVKVFIARALKVGIVLTLAVAAGLIVLVVQISKVEGNTKSGVEYITDTLNRRALGKPNDYGTGSNRDYLESLEARKSDVVLLYLKINAFNTQTAPALWQMPYWQMISLFAIFTLLFIIKHRGKLVEEGSKKGTALIAATWYSSAAPLSWFIIFSPTSYIHTFLFPMAWQMPFTLLGLALCGYVIGDLFQSKVH